MTAGLCVRANNTKKPTKFNVIAPFYEKGKTCD